jgi:PKD repeat protein
VQFTDLSTGDLDTWLWDFGDGITSTLQNPTHTFATVGVYTVSLTVSGLGGIDTLMQPDYIAVYEPALANFTADVTSGLAPLSVQFTDLSTGDLDTWLWDFGDGITSTLQSPGHLYMMAGTYTITLTVSGLGGTDSQTRSAYITVEEPEDPYFEIYLPIVVRLE